MIHGETAERLSQRDRGILQHELDLLQILHHRNKNQHRGAVWYKYLKVLKSTLSRIIALPEPVAGQALSKSDRAENAKIEASLEREKDNFWQRHEAIYVGITQIIGTGQYVALGMILLGVLARIWCILRSTEPLTSDSEGEVAVVRDTLEDNLDVGIAVPRPDTDGNGSSPGSTLATDQQCTRNDLPAVEETSESTPRMKTKRSRSSMDTATSIKKEKSKKKKKKKKNQIVDEIDSIFG